MKENGDGEKPWSKFLSFLFMCVSVMWIGEFIEIVQFKVIILWDIIKDVKLLGTRRNFTQSEAFIARRGAVFKKINSAQRRSLDSLYLQKSAFYFCCSDQSEAGNFFSRKGTVFKKNKRRTETQIRSADPDFSGWVHPFQV